MNNERKKYCVILRRNYKREKFCTPLIHKIFYYLFFHQHQTIKLYGKPFKIHAKESFANNRPAWPLFKSFSSIKCEKI